MPPTRAQATRDVITALAAASCRGLAERITSTDYHSTRADGGVVHRICTTVELVDGADTALVVAALADLPDMLGVPTSRWGCQVYVSRPASAA